MKLKKFLASIAISTLAVLGVAAQSSKAVESSIVAVTVYTDRALVTRRAEFVLPAGESTLVFSGLPSSTDPSSVQVKGAGAFSLRDVRVASRQLARDVSAQLKALEDEKRAVEDRLYAVNDRIKEAEAERQFLADMAKRLTGNAGDSETLPLDTAAWARMLDFYRTRNEAVNERIRTARREAQATQAELDRVNREIKALGSGGRLSVLEAELVVEARTAGKASVELSYLVAGPSWRPDYVLQADSEARKLSVHYRALVRQNTGEDWEGASLSLSTARPQAGGSLPDLPPWFVDLYRPAPLAESAKSSRAMAAPAPMAAESLYDSGVEAPPAMEYREAGAITGASSVQFAVAGRTSVASDNKDRTLSIAVLELEARFSYAAVPKLSPYAYLRAELTNSSDYPFLPGATHVYVDGGYVADASMGNVPGGGTFHADLGIDEGIRVERALKKKYDETTGVLSKKSRTTWEYELRIKNGKRSAVELLVFDQLPASMNEQIVIRALAPAYTKDTDTLRKLENGNFQWTLKLAPGQETALPLAFSVEYPRGTPIIGLE